jgi:N-acetylmuramoyl-L-alanine amidase
MYNDALAREQTVRAALSAADATPAVLVDVRAAAAGYEAVVRHYPASAYSDNALWQGGRLLLDAFTRFGQAADKDAGIRMLKRLAVMYPTSKLARQVPEQLTRANSDEIRLPEDVVTSHTPPQSARPSGAARPAPAAADHPPSREAAAAAPLSSTRVATIKGIRRIVLADTVRITIELDGEVPFHDERIQDPARVFVDLPGTRPAPALIDQTIRFEGDADIVRQVRVGRHPNNTTRVVLDAAGVTSYSVYPLYSPYRLVIDCVRVPPAVAAAGMTDKVLARVPPSATPQASRSNEDAAAAIARPATAAAPARQLAASVPPLLPARTMTNPWLRKLPGMAPRATTLLAVARQSVEGATTTAASPRQGADDTKPAASLAPPLSSRPSTGAATTAVEQIVEVAPSSSTTAGTAGSTRQTSEGVTAAAPAHNATGGLSIARQLGLGVSRIVIDPGHGGHDPGAKGKGVTEAELVLDVALRLEKLLQKVPGVEVILTRRTDDFIPLPERTAIANREGADLFLSIHANASTNGQAHGIETYFLNFANNQSAAAVAARENAASTQAMGGLPDFVKAIALNNKLDESRDFALHVQRAMVERQKTVNKLLKDLGVKQAPFVVLIGANMPSVLAEMGFVTNAPEAKLLKANAYRQKIAESLFNAIRKYQTSLKNVSTVALQ